MQFIKKKELRNIGLFLVIILIIFKFFNTPYNLYSVLNWNYEKRMEQNYGFCNNESWGFYNLVINKFNLDGNEIFILNDEGYRTLENFFNIKKASKNDANYLIILNYQSQGNENIFNGKYDFIKNYKILFRKNNCYLLGLND